MVQKNQQKPYFFITNPHIKTDYRYFDQYNLKKIEVKHLYGKYNDAAVSDKLMRMNYDLHTRAVFGLAGKYLPF